MKHITQRVSLGIIERAKYFPKCAVPLVARGLSEFMSEATVKEALVGASADKREGDAAELMQTGTPADHIAIAMYAHRGK